MKRKYNVPHFVLSENQGKGNDDFLRHKLLSNNQGATE